MNKSKWGLRQCCVSYRYNFGKRYWSILTAWFTYSLGPIGFSIKRATGAHYNDAIMRAMASQITSLTIVYSTVYPCADQRKHQSSASLAFVWGIHRWPVNSPHKGPVPQKMFPLDDVFMNGLCHLTIDGLVQERHNSSALAGNCRLRWCRMEMCNENVLLHRVHDAPLYKIGDYIHCICDDFSLFIKAH